MGNAGYGNHDAPPAGAGGQDRPGPEGGSGQESSSPAALGVSPQDQSTPDPTGEAESGPGNGRQADHSSAADNQDTIARNAIEGHSQAAGPGQSGDDTKGPPAGPHADPDLVNPMATPGTGALPPPGEHDDVDSTSS